MRICLLGEYRGNLDEGMRITSHMLSDYLSKKNEVLALDIRDIPKINLWRIIKGFEPEIIHYLHGPSIKSFFIAKILNSYCNDSKIIMSAIHPVLNYSLLGLLRLIEPDLILTQSYEIENIFRYHGYSTKFLPCGVDVHKFRPVTLEIKKNIRKKYGLDVDKFLILHVGSIKTRRNVKSLINLKKDDNQILVIAPTSTNADYAICNRLEDAGCIIWREYFQNIEEIYASSDVYIYPTYKDCDLFGRTIADSIETPLSVLEAMACNLPIISTKFGSLPRLFSEGNGLYFSATDEFNFYLDLVKKEKSQANTRDKVLPYSWENISNRLIDIYSNLLD